MPESEEERLRRLRDQQVAARDPHIKTRKFQKETAVKARKYKKKLNLKDMWAVIPHFWRAVIYSSLVGLLLLAIVPLVWHSKWAMPSVILGTIIIIAVSAIIGQALDKRDEIRDLIK